MKNKILLALLIFLQSCSALNSPASKVKDKEIEKVDLTRSDCFFPYHAPYPGGIVNIKLNDKKSQDIEEIYALNGKDPTLCITNDQDIHLLLPIPLDYKKNKIIVQIGRAELSIPIEDKKYRESRINIKDENYVNPSKKSLKRIRSESIKLEKTKKIMSPSTRKNYEMLVPVEGLVSSEFGVNRFINDLPKNRHTGMDIAAPKGTVIRAPLGGIVLINENFFYRGNVIFLDHGNGLITSYSHLDKSYIKNGEVVSTGQSIGVVGKTGRVTGPHLHWEITLQGVPIDPELFLR